MVPLTQADEFAFGVASDIVPVMKADLQLDLDRQRAFACEEAVVSFAGRLHDRQAMKGDIDTQLAPFTEALSRLFRFESVLVVSLGIVLTLSWQKFP